jgi:ketosteroid isomerase-like protein
MSRENVEVVRRMLDAWREADVATALAFYDPDVEWDGTNLPDGQVGRGHEAVLDHVRRWADQWDEWTVEVERAIDAGSDHVVVFIRERGQSKSGLTMDEIHSELYTLRDGRIVRRKGFSDANEALRVLGLPE